MPLGLEIGIQPFDFFFFLEKHLMEPFDIKFEIQMSESDGLEPFGIKWCKISFFLAKV